MPGVEKAIPLKQGLKLIIAIPPGCNSNRRKGNSIKTRIETPVNLLAQQQMYKVEKAIPLKQGLKPVDSGSGLDPLYGRKGNSIKTRIETFQCPLGNKPCCKSKRQFH